MCFYSILEMILKYVHRAAPRMGINEGAMRRLDVVIKFSRRQPRQQVRGLVVQVGGGAECLRPKITLIVF